MNRFVPGITAFYRVHGDGLPQDLSSSSPLLTRRLLSFESHPGQKVVKCWLLLSAKELESGETPGSNSYWNVWPIGV